ncbi:MAG: AsmA-like C-terminal region-containing protein, partial [Candidatus Competibacteraceae bacterium]|nr:AsmA-like C-terminal region-containing protein [Candidatus Competibacteraceae bacterium]
ASRNDGLYLELAGEAVAGQLRLPATPDQPMTIALNHLWLEREDGLGIGDRGSAADPRRLPPLALTVADLRLEGRSLGALRLNLKSGSKGVRLDDLELESPLHELVVRGQWQAGELGQLTQLNLNFSSHDLSDTLTRLGLEPGLEAGEADLAARLEWHGPLFALDPGVLSGQAELQVGSGRLSRLEPGVARMIGLFSLASLTRRLALDFSDLFREGLAFDSIDGAFTLKDGQLLTDNLIIEGPAADIGIRGRIGLADRDQQLQVTVLPQMEGMLPMAGAIAGGPAVGAALFLAQQLFKEDIGAITRYRYRVTGTWDDPVVEATERPLRPHNRSAVGGFGDR